MEDLPNGFTGFANRREGFVSAGEASRISRGIASGHNTSSAPAQTRLTSTAAPVPAKATPFDEDQLARISAAEARGAWVKVDLAAIRYNVAQSRRFVQPRCRMMAVVEADAYGHGDAEVAKAALGAGVDRLGVATVAEALALREAGITAPILVLSQPPLASIPLLLANNVVPSAYDPAFAVAYGEEADRHGMKAPYQLALNTGMNHIGVRFDEAVEFLYQVSFHRALELEGVFTDYATADASETFELHMQARRFSEAIQNIRAAGFDPGIVHAADAAVLYRFPDLQGDMVRIGEALCGFHPCAQTRSLIDLRPAMSVHARIVDIRMPGVSEGVSRGLRYRSPGSVAICTLPLGAADGLRFALSDNIDFIMQGRYFRQVGEICMNQTMFEVDMRRSAVREPIYPQIGDEVLVVGNQGAAAVTMQDMAEKLHTSQCEIAIGFAQRLPRVFA